MSGLAVLFDLDGTLTDSSAGITGCIRHALGRLGRPCPKDDELAAYIGPPLRGTFSTLLGTTDPALIDTALSHYRARYDETGYTRIASTTASPRCWKEPRDSRTPCS